MFLLLMLFFFLGVPIALSLIITALLSAGFAIFYDIFSFSLLYAYPQRLLGQVLRNDLLLAIPSFILIGKILEYGKIAEKLLLTIQVLCANHRAGILIAIIVVGTMLAAISGIAGASIVTLTLLCFSTATSRGYNKAITSGAICAAGSLGQLIPPSILLLILTEQMRYAHINSQYEKGNFAPDVIALQDVFAAAIIPGVILAFLYILYILLWSYVKPRDFGYKKISSKGDIHYLILFLSLLLIFAVLGSIIFGIATPSEAAAIGVLLSLILSWRYIDVSSIKNLVHDTLKITAIIFFIVIASQLFILIFRASGGGDIIIKYVQQYNLSFFPLLIFSLFIMFILGFFLDFLEITLIIIPVIAPILLLFEQANPILLILIFSLILQTSFLTPPFGLALFYFKAAIKDYNNIQNIISMSQIYKGIIPFVLLQILLVIFFIIYMVI